MDSAGDVEEGLVYGDALDSRREVLKYGYDLISELLILAEVATHEKQVSTKLAGPPPRHTSSDAVAPGLIRRREDDTATDSDRPVSQQRVQELLHRRVEGI
jgi:hypothetical protein